VARQLRREGESVGRRRVARLMRGARLQGRSARRYHRSMVRQCAFFASVPNQQWTQVTQAPNQIWVGDVTYLKVAGQWRYLAVVMDRHSRRVLGWSLSARRDAALTSDALRHSVRKRPAAPGLMFHSDRGIEYAAFDYRNQLARLGITQSMNRPGKMNDNAHMESFFHSMKAEDLHGRRFDGRRTNHSTSSRPDDCGAGAPLLACGLDIALGVGADSARSACARRSIDSQTRAALSSVELIQTAFARRRKVLHVTNELPRRTTYENIPTWTTLSRSGADLDRAVL